MSGRDLLTIATSSQTLINTDSQTLINTCPARSEFLPVAAQPIPNVFCKVRRRLRTCFGMLVNSPPCTRGPSRRPTRRDGTLSDATGNEPDLLNSFTVSCVLTTWDFWVAVLRPRPKGAYSFHGDSGVAVWVDTQHEQQGTTRIAKRPYWLTLREDASTCETRSETGDLPSFLRSTGPRNFTPKSLVRKMSLRLPMDFNMGLPVWS